MGSGDEIVDVTRSQVKPEESKKTSNETIRERVESKKTENLEEVDEKDDPWLAVKPEYKRKDSSSSDKEPESDYTIQVKVTTKETCLGRKLHSREGDSNYDWKMDVTCTQQGQIPSIVEGHDDIPNGVAKQRMSKSGFD